MPADTQSEKLAADGLYENLQYMLSALNRTLNSLHCQRDQSVNRTESPEDVAPGKDDYAYLYILFVMFLFAVTVGSLILGYTRSKKVEKRSDPYHQYIKSKRISVL
ncbi:potassium voltage-gated channel subfamily E member 3-like [Rhinatrema bivittatum]|uniref:potassium voltage-gated channel subfamily E member 3 n=1 Tax=Rhinatrema bivittatum TaxID=194408 RepID=UPI00112DE5E0|nr:potassium voltage-gated channel subfamily E member 3 [Rhinatrema bivittatum]XP_029457932.1 potassium voltage-gated channel subfamily E member 3 [Rhinatrema bivittatum]XP_029457935.1 potassium voltage-gated channel subfamily E member 3-like [Rhinatrema bivittatum]XP_029457936.1 potassium voltage-gated channel subfamily E member 3-like [Rhinatrema bivittatum]XP_029457937.1 potassium voltage-gated channel subfamily E member 3-like [Rhinatrema bivittatum]XP_029457938.1 potassium voltage-gated c